MNLYDCVRNFTMIDEVTLDLMAGLAALARDLDGALVQCGCWRGGSAAVLRAVLGPRPVWLFDSFQGMPVPQKVDGKRARWKYELIPDWHRVAPEDVRAAFNAAGVPWDGVTIVPGWFIDTVPSAPVGAIAFLHIGADWYQSTQVALSTFYDRVQPGGIVLIDDYGYWPGCRKAVDEFRDARHLIGELTMINRSAGYWTVV